MLPSLQFCLLAAAAAVSLGVHANGEPPGLMANQDQAVPQAISTVHKLSKTYFDTGSTTVALSAGIFTTVGTQLTVNCNNAAGCAIAGNFNAQLSASGAVNNAAVCLVIDGSSVNCPYNAIIPASGGYQVVSYQTFASVPLGNHTVDMQVYSKTASTLSRWNKEIKLYKP